MSAIKYKLQVLCKRSAGFYNKVRSRFQRVWHLGSWGSGFIRLKSLRSLVSGVRFWEKVGIGFMTKP